MALQIYISIVHICADLKDQGWPTLVSWGDEIKPLWRFPKTAIWAPSTSRMIGFWFSSNRSAYSFAKCSILLFVTIKISVQSIWICDNQFLPSKHGWPLWWLVQTYLPGAALRRQRSHYLNQEWESFPSCMLLARLLISITHSRLAFSGKCVRSWLYEHSLYLTEIALSSHLYLDKLSSSCLCRPCLCCVRNIIDRYSFSSR